jgi:hypothetical protein
LTTEFIAWPKTPRWEKPIVITEKIDGTNGQIHITDEPREFFDENDPTVIDCMPQYDVDNITVLRVGSRNRYLTLKDDNFGFARWAKDNALQLYELGYGRHFGEWWGEGIQRGYNKKRKYFSLFNVARWYDPVFSPDWSGTGRTDNGFFDKSVQVPECLNVVPKLFYGTPGPNSQSVVDQQLIWLRLNGSKLCDPWDYDVSPEGIVIFHTGSNTTFKAFLPGQG